MRELPPDRRADLRYRFRRIPAGRAAPSARRAGWREPRGRRRNGRNRSRRRALVPPPPAPPSSFPPRKRDAVRAFDDVLPDLRREQLVAGDRSMMAITSRGARRLIVSAVTCGRPIHGAANSGRKLTNSRTRKRSILSTSRPNVSRLEGSVQCASSKIIKTGVLPADRLDLADQRLHRFLPALLRGEFARGIAAVIGQATACRARSAASSGESTIWRAARRACRALFLGRPHARARPRAPCGR